MVVAHVALMQQAGAQERVMLHYVRACMAVHIVGMDYLTSTTAGGHMRRTQHGAKISPSIRLEKIEITLSDYEPPVIEMKGRLMTGNRRADMASTVTIKSGLIGQATNEFIAELKAAFSDRVMPTTEKERA